MLIEEEIKEMAENLEKSVAPIKEDSPKEILMKALLEMGPAEILKKSASLSVADRTTLFSVLTDMKKAVEMDGIDGASYIKGKVYQDTVIQEEVANDDVDEKLIKPESNVHNHQGDQTPDGREENKVEDPKDKKDKMKKADSELYKSLFVLGREGKTEAEMTEFALSKGYDMDTLSVVGDMIKFAIMENNRRSTPSMDTEHPMYKALHEMCSKGKSTDYMKGYGMAKGGVSEDSLYKMIGHLTDKKDESMVKSKELYKAMYEMVRKGTGREDIMKAFDGKRDEVTLSKMYESMAPKATEKGNPEEAQSADNLERLHSKKSPGDSSRPKELKLDDDNDDAQDKVDNLKTPELKKSISWGHVDDLLKAGAGGQNFHYSMGDMYKESVDILDRIDALNSSFKKSDKRDVQSIIEKGEDALPGEVLVKAALTRQHIPKASPTSFELEGISALLGIRPNDVKDILGE